jgi:hypothetical protein
MSKRKNLRRLSRSGLLLMLLATACTQSAIFSSSGDRAASGGPVASDSASSGAVSSAPPSNSPAAGKSYAAVADRSIGSASPDKWQPPPDPVISDDLPNTERISLLPGKVGECADTTITAITDRFGADLTPPASRKGADKGTIVRFSNSGVQVSLEKERAVARSQIFDKVNMCLVSIPRDCPAGDIRGRVYKTTNLRTGESWNLANDVHSCGGA